MPKINSCRICQNKELKPVFDLGRQPLANSLLKTRDEKETSYPLALVWCPECNLIQLNYTVPPEKLFSKYLWVTGTSRTAREFSETFCRELLNRTKNSKEGYVLEVASNDGTFLIPFVRRGFNVLGIDPAKNIEQVAEKNGVPTRCVFFGKREARKLVKEKGPARIVFARNVMPHVAHTRDFVEGLAISLENEGTLAIEAHYAKKILEELHYDSIYHEHLCYFTFKSLEGLLNDFNLHVFDIKESPISGGSMIVYARKGKVREAPVVLKYRESEKKNKINDLASWQNFGKKSFLHRQQLLEAMDSVLKNGEKLAGYGASARSSTLLNFCGIDSKHISFIADQNPLKQNLFTAGTRIQIKSPEDVMRQNPQCLLMLAWNFGDEIIEILKKKFNWRGKVIIPLPNKVRVKQI
jgi:hypothetical protein